MSNNALPQVPTASSSSSANTQRIHHQQQPAGNIYSFSVHQPYTNWPLHASTAAPYAPSWYAMPAQSYGPPKTYRENSTQTRLPGDEGVKSGAGKGKGKENAERPPLQYKRHWDAALSKFLKCAGLFQALSGLHEDMLLLNVDWEREQLHAALQAFVKDISDIETEKDSVLVKQPLDERKLEYVHTQNGTEAQSPSTVAKSVSRLLRQSRKRNDASNRAEFLKSHAEKRRRLTELGEPSSASPTVAAASEAEQPSQTQPQDASGVSGSADDNIVSCARTDAKPQNRDLQMKYDIAKNEDGPLRRTMKQADQGKGTDPAIKSSGKRKASGDEFGVGASAFAKQHLDFGERFGNIEAHVAVRYVPSPPRSLHDRLKFLEDHIIKLEREYPPWAALHFSQPNRGWPPPPRLTPIIVPPHLASWDSRLSSSGDFPSTSIASDGQNTLPKAGTGAKSAKMKPIQSSLHRAVMEKLEIQRAMGDL
ncbi:hypothetical protein DFH11DRAFT_1739955 [Phellopilus nigrolimitatus]|nr:hypothetical protein DFH11DRAFT_1739955 [Phellopilus nigrolimitatus]